MPYPINEIYAWVIDDPSGTHGILGVQTPELGLMQAVSSKFKNLASEDMLRVATETANNLGLRVRLVRFVQADVAIVVQPNSALKAG
jgi:hypothetical protein